MRIETKLKSSFIPETVHIYLWFHTLVEVSSLLGKGTLRNWLLGLFISFQKRVFFPFHHILVWTGLFRSVCDFFTSLCLFAVLWFQKGPTSGSLSIHLGSMVSNFMGSKVSIVAFSIIGEWERSQKSKICIKDINKFTPTNQKVIYKMHHASLIMPYI